MTTLLILAALAIVELTPRVLRLNPRWGDPADGDSTADTGIAGWRNGGDAMRVYLLAGLAIFITGCGKPPKSADVKFADQLMETPAMRGLVKRVDCLKQERDAYAAERDLAVDGWLEDKTGHSKEALKIANEFSDKMTSDRIAINACYAEAGKP